MQSTSLTAVSRRLPLAACLSALLTCGPAHEVAAAAASNTVQPSRPASPAGSLSVTSCSDDGSPGTLRNVVASAPSGATIDLTELTCSTISLQSGAIDVTADDLAIVGPGQDALTIDGGFNGRVFRHGGTGVLSFSGLTITHGLAQGDGTITGAYGGCIVAYEGGIELTDATVTGCRAVRATSDYFASSAGGGINAGYATLALLRSTVTDCQAISGDETYNGGFAIGGGIFSRAPITLTDSTISNNRAQTSYVTGLVFSNQGTGGGVAAYAGATVTRSIISNNFAGCDSTTQYCHAAVGSGLRVDGGDFTMTASSVFGNVADSRGRTLPSVTNGAGLDVAGFASIVIDRTTISGNSAQGATSHRFGGGLMLEAAIAGTTTVVSNSTIAGNSAESGGGVFTLIDTNIVNSTISGNAVSGSGGAIFLSNLATWAYASLTLRASTVTANTSSGASGGAGIADYHDPNVGPIRVESSIVAANVNSVDDAALDADIGSGYASASVTGSNNIVLAASGITLPADTINADPMLGPLQDNGGPTWTHALLEGSPALDAGNNSANLDNDQRGAPFLRIYGSAVDIGAFEFQPGTVDEVFLDGFDGASSP